MIFHHPHKVIENGQSASTIRPFKMLQAFKNLGYEVDLVDGSSWERKRKIREILKNKGGLKKTEFVYSEFSTVPIQLTDPHHIPIRPNLDFNFFKELSRRGIKTGIFYRDVYWKYDSYGENLSPIKKYLALKFYKQEIKMLNKTANHVFLPSLEMGNYVPLDLSISALPPGCPSSDLLIKKERNKSDFVKLFYVGGVRPPYYDLSDTFEVVKSAENVNLKVVCRKNEWCDVNDYYSDIITDKVEILHQSGDELTKHYEDADFMIIFMRPHSYQEFSISFKLYEAIGSGVPIIARRGTAVGTTVDANKVGQCFESVENLVHYFKSVPDPNVYKSNLLKACMTNSWESRCQKVANVLG